MPPMTPTMPQSGQDAVIVGAGLQVPLWQGNYSDAVEAARSQARAFSAEQQALRDRSAADLATRLAQLRDARRRIELYGGTLIAQAETVYESALGSFTVGTTTVAQMLLAQQALLELRVELDAVRAEHARAWARLEETIGRPVRAGDSHE